MAELVLRQKQCISGHGAVCRPACPGAGGHLWWGNHGHIRGLSPVQDGLEGHCAFGAGQVRIHLDVDSLLPSPFSDIVPPVANQCC